MERSEWPSTMCVSAYPFPTSYLLTPCFQVTQIPQSAYAEIVGEVVKSGDALAVQAKHVIEMGDMLGMSP